MTRYLIVPATTDTCPDTAIIKEIEAATLALRTARTKEAVKAARQQLEALRAKYRAATCQ